jgi:ABC-type xylose transport system permease subunit
METEPYAFFAAKTLLFVAAIVLFSWLLASYKGLPNVLVVMAVLIVAGVVSVLALLRGGRGGVAPSA